MPPREEPFWCGAFASAARRLAAREYTAAAVRWSCGDRFASERGGVYSLAFRRARYEADVAGITVPHSGQQSGDARTS